MSSRNIEDLSPAMCEKVNIWIDRMKAEGITFIITCTRRSQEEQEELYAKGRTAPGNKVTWTLNSKHLTGDAIDFIIMDSGKPDWSMRRMDLWKKAARIGAEIGLSQVIGKDGKIKEWAHLQL